jgi:hypothetical protein
MATTSSTQTPPAYKLGKSAAQFDKRNLKFSTVLKKAALVPDTYDFDKAHPGIPIPMFANDQYGDCVIAGRAHQTLRFELLEQKRIIAISENDVLNEYFRQTGGPAYDTGLVVLDSLKEWRTNGWKVDGNTYFISAFAEINYASMNEVKQAVYGDIGVGLGLQLPLSAQQQILNNQPWEVTQGPDTGLGSWGGHYVYVCGYTPNGPVCITWGSKQHMSWEWVAKYADESYAIFDAHNNFNKSIIDEIKLNSFINNLL